MALEPVSSDLSLAAARLARVVERALATAGLSLPQYRLLGFLATGPAAAAQLADKLTVSRPSITALVDGLVAQGLVARSRDDTDRRRVRHELTPQGHTALGGASEAVGTRLAELLDSQPPRVRWGALSGLAALKAALDVDRARRLGSGSGGPDGGRARPTTAGRVASPSPGMARGA